MGGLHHPHIGAQRPEIGRGPAVDSHTVVNDAVAHDALGERADGGRNLLVGALQLGEPIGECGSDLLFGLRLGLLALGLVGNRHRRGQLVGADLGHRRFYLGGVVHLEVVFHGGLHPGSGNETALETNCLFDPLLGPLQALGQSGLIHLGGAVAVVLPARLGAVGLHHHDCHVAVVQNPSGNHHLERGFGALGVGGMGNPLPIGTVGHPHRPDRAGERDARDAQCSRRPVDGDHVVGVLLIGAQNGSDDVDLVAEPVGKRGPQRSIDESARQDGRLGGPTLPPEERARDLARGIHPLFDVDGEGEEVDTLANTTGSRRGHQDGGVAHASDYGTVGLSGQTTCLKRQGFVLGTADYGRDGDGFRHFCSSPDHAWSERAGRSQFPVGEAQPDSAPSTGSWPLSRPAYLFSVGRPGDTRFSAAQHTQRRRPRSAMMPRYRSTSLSLT